MKKLIFATNNQHKLAELRDILGTRCELVGLSDIGCNEDIPETAETLRGNAAQKAEYVANKFGLDCFADDTGLEVRALDGRPGVYTARYAGPECLPEDNMRKLLGELEGRDDRYAEFKTVICLWEKDGGEHFFEGICPGHITSEKHGGKGFGYDPVFIPEGYDKTFAELGEEIKNKISHRARAVALLAEYLNRDGK